MFLVIGGMYFVTGMIVCNNKITMNKTYMECNNVTGSV